MSIEKNILDLPSLLIMENEKAFAIKNVIDIN